MKQIGIATICILLSALFNIPAYSQATSRVTGTVQDPGGAFVPNAIITLTNEATNVSVETKTTSSGTYVFDGIIPGTYTVSIEAQGFSTFVSRGNVLTIAQPMVLNATVKVGQTTEKIEVSAEAAAVQTETAGDLGALVDSRALQTLPVVGARGRSPISLIEVTIPGVVDGGPLNSTGANIEGGGVSVNGSRDRAWNYTLDGIDTNETSAPGSNFSPLRTNPDSIEGFRVITGNADAQYGVTSGAQVIQSTRAGTNSFHGKVFWFYQTPGFNANDAANLETIPITPRPQFVQHIPGFSVGGPIFKNKTFFFVNLQLLHASQSFLINSLVYTQQARAGLIRYVQQTGNFVGSHNDNAASSDPTVDGNGNPLSGIPIGSYNVGPNDPTAAGLDSTIQNFLGRTPAPNNFNIGDGLNTAGFQFLAPEQERQVDFTIRIDHQFNSKHSIFGRWAQGHQNTVGDIGNGGLPPFPGAPNIVDTFRQPRNLAISWRYTPSSRITNEAIVGMNRFGFNFANPDPHFLQNPPFVFVGDAIDASNNVNLTLPLQNYVGNKRVITTLQFVDNLNYVRGAHALTFGTNLRYQRHIDDRGSIGIYDAQPLAFFNPSIASNFAGFNLPTDIDGVFDIVTLKNAVNNLLGRISDIQQGFVAQNANTYAPPGTHLRDDFRMPEYDFYGQDSWKVRRNLTLTAGLRWEIKLSPRVGSNFLLHPNQPFNVDAPPSDTIAWVPGKLYKDAWKNFAPTIGVAWDPRGDGKQSIRADYRLAYDRMNTFVLSASIFQGLPGEALAIDQKYPAGARVSAGIPVVSPPAGVTPVSLRQPIPFSTTSITAVDPNWTPPQVHEWSLSVQRQVTHDSIFEIAYVGKHAVHLFGGYDSNQAEIHNNGFLNAFNAVYQPFLATGTPGDSPLIDSLVANDPGFQSVGGGATGSQYLAGTCPNVDCSGSAYAFDFAFGGVAAVAAELGSTADTNGNSLPVAAGLSPTFFFKYPQFSGQTASPGFVVLDSNDWSWYHALQAQYHGRYRGIQFQANYTWSKSEDTRSFDPTFGTVIGGSSTFGSSSTPFDINNRRLNYAPSDFDRTHVFQGVWTYQVPFGVGHSWGGNLSPALNRILGGWEINGSTVIESGRPFTIYSPGFTTSDIVRTPASCNGCSPHMLHVNFNPDTQALNYFTTAQMNLFFTPAPGQVSNLGRNFFRLPGYSVANISLGKVTKITEGTSFEVRLEMQNAFNSRHFEQPASARINSGIFGSVDPLTVNNNVAEGSSPRTMQLAAKFSF